MKIWALAKNTFSSFARDRIIVLFLILFACVILLMMTPLFELKAMRSLSNAQAVQTLVLGLVSSIAYLVSGCGSLLAAWAAADCVAKEMRSGTILAVMARPVKRWEFLAGKYLGVLLLMSIYTLLVTGLIYLLVWMGGQRLGISPWVLIVYPLVRYAIYAAIAMLLVTVLHPVISFAITVAIAVLALIVTPAGTASQLLAPWIRKPLYTILPSTGLLSETQFLSLTQSSLKPFAWTDHATALAYGLDYALVCLLLAMWSFHHRSLKRD